MRRITSIVSARELYNKLNITTPYAEWIESIKEYGFNEGFDFIDVDDDTIMSISMATSICIITKSPQASKIMEALEAA